MDYVYICRPGENEELKYSIRSVESNLDHRNIWLIGYKPDWYKGNFFEVKDKSTKFENIRNCIETITTIEDISNEFTLMNDDFYIMKPMKQVPMYHGGLLDDKISRYVADSGSTRYTRILALASKQIKRKGIEEPLDYDIHTPMIMNKYNLAKVVDMNLAPRSTYGNIFNVGGTQIDDVKIYRYNNKIDDSSGIFSTEDRSIYLVRKMLIEHFPTRSSYEK